jgi:hypothetical protein
MPDIRNAGDIEKFKQQVYMAVENAVDRLREGADEAISNAALATEAKEQLKLLPELLKDATLLWVTEADVSPHSSALDGGSIQFFGTNPPQVDFGHDHHPRTELASGRHRFFLIGFPVEFPSKEG